MTPLPPSRRVTREVARRLLSLDGTRVTVRDPTLVEDVDGMPAGVEVETSSAVLYVTAELLGSTRSELDLVVEEQLDLHDEEDEQ